jgi:hypothetical protein
MSQTQRRHSACANDAADRGLHRRSAGRRRTGSGDQSAPAGTPTPRDRGDTVSTMPPEGSRRIDLLVLFEDEPDAYCGAAEDDWRMLGLDPDELCVGSDGLVRLTVV